MSAYDYEAIRKHDAWSSFISAEVRRQRRPGHHPGNIPTGACSLDFRFIWGRPWKGGEQKVIEREVNKRLREASR